jgi:hypothetical protein
MRGGGIRRLWEFEHFFVQVVDHSSPGVRAENLLKATCLKAPG